jgi:hypothetical protein
VPGAGEMIAAECGGHDYTDPGTPSIAWDNAAARDAPVTALISDANVVLHAFAAVPLQRAAAEAFALLALVAGQDVEPADRLGSHRPVVADRTKRRSRQGNFGCVSGSAGAGTHPRLPSAVTLSGDES